MNITVVNGNINSALKLLKKKITETKIFDEVRERQYYEKPSEARRKILKDAEFSQMLKNRAENNNS